MRQAVKKIDKVITIMDLFDSSLASLIEWRLGTFDTVGARLYASAVEAFLTSDVDRLALHRDQAFVSRQRSADDSFVWICTELRWQIRSREIAPDFLEFARDQGQSHQIWEGEVFALLAFAYEHLGHEELSRDFNLVAAKGLERVGASKKALRMLANSVAAESRINPHRHCLSDLLYIVRKARVLREDTALSLALMHLSREYQRIGAFELSLRYATKAVTVANRDCGSLVLANTLAQRCHVLAAQGMEREARFDYQQARAFRFAVVQSGLDLLAEKYGFLNTPAVAGESARQPLKFWDQLRHDSVGPRLTKSEQTVVEHLSARPRAKVELVLSLYGAKIDSRSAENRFFNLLNRLRKKYPNLILFSNGKYRLRETPVLPGAWE